jgi:hypothetical protein
MAAADSRASAAANAKQAPHSFPWSRMGVTTLSDGLDQSTDAGRGSGETDGMGEGEGEGGEDADGLDAE